MPVAAAADCFRVSRPTAKRWSDRYRDLLAGSGQAPTAAAMIDRSSRPHRSPNRTPEPVKRRIVHLRWKKRLGPVQIAGELGRPASTVHAVLVRCRINRLTHIDRAATVQQSGPVRLEPTRRRAWLDGVELDLTAREYDVVAYLAARPDQVVAKQALLEDVWLEPYAAPNLVEVCVAGLRRKVGAGLIETVRNVGYRLATDTT